MNPPSGLLHPNFTLTTALLRSYRKAHPLQSVLDPGANPLPPPPCCPVVADAPVTVEQHCVVRSAGQRFCRRAWRPWDVPRYVPTSTTYTTVDQIGPIPTRIHHHVAWLSALAKVLQKSCQPSRAEERVIHPQVCRAVGEQWERESDVPHMPACYKIWLLLFHAFHPSCSWTISIPLVSVVSVALAYNQLPFLPTVPSPTPHQGLESAHIPSSEA